MMDMIGNQKFKVVNVILDNILWSNNTLTATVKQSVTSAATDIYKIQLCNLSLYEMIGNPIHSRTGVLVFWTPI